MWLRAAHKIAPNGARFPDTSYYPVKSHGTVETVPYKPIDRLQMMHKVGTATMPPAAAVPIMRYNG